jgi:hypothetical protein
MSTLAFDPDRLESLRRRMTMAAAELRSLRCDDATAASAMHAVAVAAEELEEVWLPFVERLRTSDALLPRDRRALGGLDNALAWVMSKGYGWTAGSDPLATTSMDAATARATGVRISSLDPVALSHDGAAMRGVADALATAATDPRLATELMRNWIDLDHFLDVLGAMRSRALAPDTFLDTDVHALDALFAHLMDVVAAASADPRVVLDHVSPCTAAAIVAGMHLDDEHLAAITDDIARRVGRGDGALLDRNVPTDALAILLPLFEGRPHAAALLAVASSDHIGDLLATEADHEAVYRLLLAATDPSVMSVAEAGQVVPALVNQFVSTGLVDDGTFIADLVVPWTAQFASGNHDWASDGNQRHDLLVAALRDDDAMNRFLQRADHALARSFEHFATRGYDTKVELTSYVGLIGDIVMNGSIRNAQNQRRGWNLLTGAASIGASLISGVAIGLVATAAVMYVQWKSAPDSHKAAHAAIWQRDVELTMLAAAQVHALDQKLRAEGQIPASVPPPPQADPNHQGDMPSMVFIQAMGPWIRQLPGGEDGEISLRMQQAMFMYVNPVDSEMSGMEYARTK